MSRQVVMKVFCAECSPPIRESTEVALIEVPRGKYDARAVGGTLAGRGWTNIDDQDICPRCSKK
jgi:hypothetical protein